MNDEIGEFDIYNVYDTCGGNSMSHNELVERMSSKTVQFDQKFSSARHPQLLKGAVNDYACGGDAVEKWLSQPSVAEALHVNASAHGTFKYNW